MNAAVQFIGTPRGLIRANVPYEDYAALDGVRISALKEIAKSPKHYRWRLAHPRQSKALALGKAAHCAVLEPERFETDFIAWTRRSEKSGNLCPRNGQHWEAFQAASVGKEIVTEDELMDARAIAAAVRGDALAMRYLVEGQPEVSMEWLNMDGPMKVRSKCRLDWLTRIKSGPPTIVEVKTSAEIEMVAFAYRADKYGYGAQLAWQHDGYKVITGDSPDMVMIVVESAPPHDVAVRPVPPRTLALGRAQYQEWLMKLAECEQSGQWPGVAGGMEHELVLPGDEYMGEPANEDTPDEFLTELEA